MKKNKIGVSLMILVITIVVMIIIASTILLTINGSGIIVNSSKAKLQNDIQAMQEELNVYISSKMLSDRNKYKKEELYADKDSLEEMGEVVEGKTIKDILSSTGSDYLDEIEIVNGEITYVGDNFKRLKWSNELLLDVRKHDVEQVAIDDKIITLEDSADLNLINYRIYGNSKDESLPTEYQQVEYIESTGTQYIDTSYLPSNITRVVVDYQYTEISNTFLFGSRMSSSLRAYTVNVGNAKKDAVSAFGNTGNVKYADPDTKRHVIDKNRNLLYLDGELKLTHPNSVFFSMYGMGIFAASNGSTKGYLPSSARIYSLKIYHNDFLVRDFIPCYRTSDSVIGLYDVVNDKFYTNDGTGTFEKGANVTNTYNNIHSVGDLVEYDEYKGKYKIPVKVTGKNIFDAKTYYTSFANDEGGITYTNGNFGYIHSIVRALRGQFKVNTRYVLSFDYELTNSDENYILPKIYYTDGTSDNGERISTIGSESKEKSGHYKIISQAGKTIDYICFTYNTSSRTCNVKLSNVMVEEGTTETEYEPYVEKTYDIYLDEPLRKVDDYVDYIDFRTQEVVRNVEVIDNSGTISLQGTDTPKREKITLPDVMLNEEFSTMTLNTRVPVSKIDTIYYTN